LEKRGLGRGLNALLAGTAAEDVARNVRELRLDAIAPNPYQPRVQFDESALAELAQSIREHGVLQPVLVRRRGPDRYELIIGERRLRASRIAGRTTIPAVVQECSDRDMLLLALIENIQREDIGPVEQARAYRRMTTDFNMTQEDVARSVGKSRQAVGNAMRLLSLPDAALAALESGAITEGHARLLVPLEPAMQTAALNAFLTRPMSVREAERHVRSLRQPDTARKSSEQAAAPPASMPPDPNLAAIEDRLSVALGTKVRITAGTEGRGTVHIEFYSSEQLEGLLDRILSGTP
jgi:ParB family chromosome partitioning protein